MSFLDFNDDIKVWHQKNVINQDLYVFFHGVLYLLKSKYNYLQSAINLNQDAYSRFKSKYY